MRQSRLFRGRSAWGLWLGLTLLAAAALTQRLTSAKGSKELFLPGKTTHGHYQIELDCAACHTKSFGAAEDFQAGCVKCHGAELERGDDSHPATKFSDPRNAARVEKLDARYCVTCHSEHQPARTGTMGLSLPADYCFHCHEDVADERESHVGLPFDSCASGGCHNFHDNKALYEDFLVKHGREPALLPQPFRPLATIGPCPAPERLAPGAPEVSSCSSCHPNESESWLGGRHGMRVARGLTPMRVASARLPMKTGAASHELGCDSCHEGSQGENALKSQVEVCEGCHDDPHTQAYRSSAHFSLLEAEMRGAVARGAGVTCATCHMPRLRDDDGMLWVNHNQNDNLRPNEKMVRTVCSNCHGVPFVVDALADAALVARNFRGQPSQHVQSVDFALARE